MLQFYLRLRTKYNFTDFNDGKITEVLAIFGHSKMYALKSQCYVKIMINNNGLGFYHEIVHIYSILTSKFMLRTAWNLIIFINSEVTNRRFSMTI